VDEQTRRRLQSASAEELRRALAAGELSEEDYEELRRQRRGLKPLYVGVLVAVGLVGLGILILCGGCALILMNPMR
jgi:hypothetical protein